MKLKYCVFFTLYLFVFHNTTVYAEEITAHPPPETSAEAVVLLDADTGIILFGKDAHERHYPASATKIMTALLTLEQCEDLSEKITFSHTAVFSLPRNASHIAMDEGETLTVYDALNGLLLSSANEVANALAEHIAGSIEDFVILMNKRAASLGLRSTHFENPTGLHTSNHYTTAYDMALIMAEAVKHPVFNQIIAKRRYDVPPTERQTQYRELLNTNRIIHPGPYFNGQAVGGKTGYTDEAQHTLVVYARDGERSLITCVLNSGRPGTYEDTNALLAYGFILSYEEQTIFDSDSYRRSVAVYHDDEVIGEVTLKGAEDLVFLLPEGFDRSAIRYEADLPVKLSPPVMIGDELGKVTCYIQNKRIGYVALTAANAVFAPVPMTAEVEGATEMVMATDVLPLELPGEEEPEPAAQIPEEAVFSLWDRELLTTFALPLAVSFFALVISFIMFISKRRQRKAQILRFDRYAKYTQLYKLK
jgi:D-alanyl-D-alanine carboxypeptidase